MSEKYQGRLYITNKMANYLMTRRGCPHCRAFIKAIKLINIKLPVEKRIQIVDCFAWENYGIELEPIMRKFSKELKEGYPICYINGILVEPSPPDVLKAYISKLLEEDLIN